MKQLRIHILHHENHTRKRMEGTMICHIASRWEKEGHHVKHLFGCQADHHADVLLLHIDLSCIPSDYIHFAEHYPRVLNHQLIDIRKRSISEHLVDQSSNYNGPVIVKTNLNCGGAPERLLGVLPRKQPFSLSRSIKKRLKIKDPASMRRPKDYLVYSQKSKVPKSVFSNEDLVVEKFQPERHGDEYYQRRYFFLGDAEYNEIHATTVPVHANDSDDHCTRYWEVPEIPEQIREYRQRLNVDFGKIDYVIQDGQVVVFDVNRTPSSGNVVTDPIAKKWVGTIVERLHSGIL